jgi:pimeloyl-ACP methyl ester carboxylesterase
MPAPFKLLIRFFVCAVLLTASVPNAVAQRVDAGPTTDAIDATDGAVTVAVRLSADVADERASGRLLVLFSKQQRSPIKGPNWFSPEPFAAMDVQQWKPGDTVTLGAKALAYPKPLSQIAAGKYYVQAILSRNKDFAHYKNGTENPHSLPQVVKIESGKTTPITLNLVVKVDPPPVTLPSTAKIVSQRSTLLSAFHRRDVIDRALVLLPPGYEDEPEKEYPVYYEITGFGPTIEDLLERHQSSAIAADGVEFIHVFLTGQTQWGHHVYANSDTNGPRGDALVKEMIPAIEKQFRAIAKPYARLLGGHSSGGWASLWLQTQYPKFFGGVWSTSPDPVDFRDWQGTDLYQAKANIFTDSNGQRRPLAIVDGKPILWYDLFSKMDDVLGRGGQLRSFEAVFSPRGDDGLPARCWDRQTGAVDAAVVEHWKQYDISNYLQTNWAQLKDDLAGKLHIFTGSQDTFLLTKAVVLMKERLEDLGSDARVEIIDGRNHFDMFSDGLDDRIYQAMAEKFNQAATADGSTSR